MQCSWWVDGTDSALALRCGPRRCVRSDLPAATGNRSWPAWTLLDWTGRGLAGAADGTERAHATSQVAALKCTAWSLK